MANSNKVTVEKVVTVKQEVVNLELSVDEAETLLFILHRIGGDPDTTPRGTIDNISSALAITIKKPTLVSRPDLITSKDNRAIYFAKPGDANVSDECL